MAISKIILNGVTQMDVTGKTVTSASMRNGVTALKNDGTDVTGSILDMTLPSSASGSSSGTSKATITPTSSAQYLNIPSGYLDAAQYYTIAAASGGSSNVVTGTFKGTTTGAAMDVTLGYTGSGYPIAVIIFPDEGPYNSGTGTFYNLVKRYACQLFVAIKAEKDTEPNWSGTGTNTQAVVVERYKNSTSNATTYGQQVSNNTIIFKNTIPSSTGSGVQIATVKNSTTLSVYIGSSSYGFAANIDYRYYVIYSS